MVDFNIYFSELKLNYCLYSDTRLGKRGDKYSHHGEFGNWKSSGMADPCFWAHKPSKLLTQCNGPVSCNNSNVSQICVWLHILELSLTDRPCRTLLEVTKYKGQYNLAQTTSFYLYHIYLHNVCIPTFGQNIYRKRLSIIPLSLMKLQPTHFFVKYVIK